VTGDLHLRVGDYLKIGDAFLEIEQTDVVTATIAIPEADTRFRSNRGNRCACAPQATSDDGT